MRTLRRHQLSVEGGRASKHGASRARTKKRKVVGRSAIASGYLRSEHGVTADDQYAKAMLLHGYVDPDSYVLFEDLPLSMRTRSGARNRRAAEYDFRSMLIGSGFVLDGGAGIVKKERPTASALRRAHGLVRAGHTTRRYRRTSRAG